MNRVFRILINCFKMVLGNSPCQTVPKVKEVTFSCNDIWRPLGLSGEITSVADN